MFVKYSLFANSHIKLGIRLTSFRSTKSFILNFFYIVHTCPCISNILERKPQNKMVEFLLVKVKYENRYSITLMQFTMTQLTCGVISKQICPI